MSGLLFLTTGLDLAIRPTHSQILLMAHGTLSQKMAIHIVLIVT